MIRMDKSTGQKWVNCYMFVSPHRIYFAAVTKKRMAEEKKLNVGLQKYTVLKRDYVHQKHDVSIRVLIIFT